MPNVWKFISRPKAEPYRCPEAEELMPRTAEPVPEPPPPGEAAEAETAPEPEIAEPEAEEPQDPGSVAQIQADQILQDAERRAAEILETARREAREQSEAILEESRRAGVGAGRAEGVALGVQQALEAGRGCVIDCAIDMDAMVHPMVGGGTPVTEFLLH